MAPRIASRRFTAGLLGALGVGLITAALAQGGAPPRPCSVLAGKEVAAAARGKLVDEPSAGPKTCAYLVEVAGGEVESYRFFLLRAADLEPMLRAQSAAERGQAVAGLLDEAWLQPPEPGGGGPSLLALRRGGIALQISGPRKEVLLALGRTAVTRLK